MLTKLSKIDLHYSRKENLLFPYLEREGITAPPKVMWGVDDEIRAKIKFLMEKIDEISREDLTLKFDELISQVKGMIMKENEILTPLLIHNLTCLLYTSIFFSTVVKVDF